MLNLYGDFTQTGSGEAFQASGAHLTRFIRAGRQTVSFASGSSRFQDLTVATVGDSLVLATNATAFGRILITDSLGGGSNFTALTGPGIMYAWGNVIMRSTGAPGVTVNNANMNILGPVLADSGGYGSTWRPGLTHFYYDRVLPLGPTFQYQNLFAQGGLQVDSAVSIAGELRIDDGVFQLVNARVQVGGVFGTYNNGKLQMTHAADTLDVAGTASFGGASTAGLLTDGVLVLRGGFAQQTTADAFVADGSHTTMLYGGGPMTVVFVNPDSSSAGSHFRHLRVETDSVTFSSDVPVNGMLITPPDAAPRILHGEGYTMQVRGLDAAHLTFDSLRLAVADEFSVARFDTITFDNMPLTGVQLRHNRSSSGMNASGLAFLTTPDSGLGWYIESEGTSGVTVLEGAPEPLEGPNVYTPTYVKWVVASCGSPVLMWNGTAYGPSQDPLCTSAVWLGATDDDWSTAANWSGGVVPGGADTVLVLSTAANMPVIRSAVPGIVELRVQNGASLTIDPGYQLTISGDADASYTSVAGAGEVRLTGAGTVKGRFSHLVVEGVYTLADSVRTTGNLTIQGAAGELVLGGFAARVDGSLAVNDQARITMAQGTDLLLVVGDATFAGGSEAGYLALGTIILHGNLTQLSTNDAASFAASTAVTYFSGGGQHTVSFASPLSSQLSFVYVATGDTVTFVDRARLGITDVQADGRLIATDTLTVQSINVGGHVTAPWLVVQNGLTATAGLSGVTYEASNTILVGNSQNVPYMTYDTLTVVGPVALADSVRTTSHLVVTDSGVVNVNQRRLVVGGDLIVGDSTGFGPRWGGGILRMSFAEDTVVVMGDAYFGGASDAGMASDGVLELQGNFRQVTSSCECVMPDDQFTATGAHNVVFSGTGTQVVQMPGSTSFFRNVTVAAASGGVELGTDVHITGGLNAAAALSENFPRVLTIDGGLTTSASLNVSALAIGGVLSAAPGSYTVGVTTFTGSGQTIPDLPYDSLFVRGTAVLGDTVVVGSKVNIGGLGATLDVGGMSLIVNGNLLIGDSSAATPAGGRLLMNSATDSVVVMGSTWIAAEGDTTFLTAGRLELKGLFVQVPSGIGSDPSFAPSGAHRTVLAGGTAVQQIVVFGDAAARFRYLENIAGSYGVSLNSDVRVSGNFTSTATSTVTEFGEFRLTVEGDVSMGGPLDISKLRVGGTLASDSLAFQVDTTEFIGNNQAIPGLNYSAIAVLGTGTATLNGNLTVYGLFVADTAQLGLGDDTLRVNGNVFATGSISATNGLLRLGGEGAAVSGTLPRTLVTGSYGNTAATTVNGAMHVTGTFTLAGTTLTVNGAFQTDSSSTGHLVAQFAGDTLIADTVRLYGSPAENGFTGGSIVARHTFHACGGADAYRPTGDHRLIIDASTAFNGNLDLLLCGSTARDSTGPYLRYVTVRSAGMNDYLKPIFIDGGLTVDAGAFWAVDSTRYSGDTVRIVSNGTFGSIAFAFTGAHQTLAPNTNFTLQGSMRVFGNLSFGDANATSERFTVAGVLHLLGDQLSMHDQNDTLTVYSALWTDITGTPMDTSLTAGVLNVWGWITNYSATNAPITASMAGSFIFRSMGNGPRAYQSNISFSMPFFTVADSADLTLYNDLSAGMAVVVRDAGVLDIQDHTVSTLDFYTLDSGRIKMQDPASVLNISGNASFLGGSTDGLLTNGVITINGGFWQSGDPNSFRATGSNITRFISSGVQTVNFASPGRLNSRFNRLHILNTGDSLELQTLVVANRVVVSDSLTGGDVGMKVGGDAGILAVLDPGAELELDAVYSYGVTVRPLSVVLEGALTRLNGVNPTVFRPSTTHLLGAGLTLPSWGAYRNVLIQGGAMNESSGNTFIDSTLTVIEGSFNPNGGTVTIGGDLVTSGTGTIAMFNYADFITVVGNARFAGASTKDSLTDGSLYLSGNFAQYDSTSATSFYALGNHVTTMNPTSGPPVRTISLATPDTTFAGTGSRFANFMVGNSGAVALHLLSDLPIERTFLTANAAARTMMGNRTIFARGLLVDGLTVDTLRMHVEDIYGFAYFDNVTWTNQPASAEQLRVVANTGYTYSFNSHNFGTVPTSGVGSYVTGINPGATGFTLYMITPTPGGVLSDPAFVKVVGSPAPIVLWDPNF